MDNLEHAVRSFNVVCGMDRNSYEYKRRLKILVDEVFHLVDDPFKVDASALIGNMKQD